MIFLFHAAGKRQSFFGSRTGTNHDDPDVLQADVSHSDDDGLTWRHRRITRDIKNPAWGGIFATSGQGIQLGYGPHAGGVTAIVFAMFGTEWIGSGCPQ